MLQLSASRDRLRLMFMLLTGWAFATAMVIPAAAAQGATMWLDPATLDISAGDNATVEIWVEGVAELAGAEIQLAFDPEILEVVDANSSTEGVQIAHGDFLTPDFVVQNEADPKMGLIEYAIACIPLDRAVSGSGVLARITLHAVAEGEASVNVDRALLANARGESIGVETSSSRIDVSGPGQRALTSELLAVVGTASVLGGCVAVVWRTIRARKAIQCEI